MTDLTAECLEDIQPGVTVPQLREGFCRTCGNAQCPWSRAVGGATLWEARMVRQEEVLFHPARDEIAAIRDQDFRDARDLPAAPRGDTGRPRVEGKDVFVSAGARIRIPSRHVPVDGPALPGNPGGAARLAENPDENPDDGGDPDGSGHA